MAKRARCNECRERPDDPPVGTTGPVRRLLRSSHGIVLALAVTGVGMMSAGGCARNLGKVIASAPNRLNLLASDANPLPPAVCLAGVDCQFPVRVGPPEATLSVAVLDPPLEIGPPRGTILVSHGFYGQSLAMMGTARRLAEAGYRAVLIDSRGHGRSSGKWLTYGPREAADLSQVIDALVCRGLLVEPLGAYGVSYGATTSIHLAGRDPRVKAVVAVAPFCSMRDEVPHYARSAMLGAGRNLDEETVQEAIDEAGRLGGFDPDLSNAALAIAQTTAPVLIIHGTSDRLVPHENAFRLRDAAPEHTRVVLIPSRGHTGIFFDLDSQTARHTRAWFDRWLR